MCCRVLLFGVLLGLAVQASNVPLRAAQGQKKSTSNAPRTLSGCVDEADGKYVLLDDHMQKIVGLHAAASNDEAAFAKHLGHTVRVRGANDTAGNGQFVVTSIEQISSSCRVAPK